jgi:hypothetical protein
VTFRAREGNVTGGRREQVPVSLPALEFTRRWCLHILPPGFTKTRAYGGWHNRRRAACLERCAILLENAPLPPTALEFSPGQWEDQPSDELGPLCPDCAGPLELVHAEDKPPWRELLHGDCRPPWYRRNRSLRNRSLRLGPLNLQPTAAAE